MTLINETEIQLQEIDAQTLKQLLEENAVTLVDVRETAEYATERIPGAQSYPLSQFDLHQIRPAAGQKLVLYCQSGNRSAKAAKQCIEAGMNSVIHLRGGIPTWKSAGYAVERSQNAPISLFRQVQIVAGSLVVVGTVLGALVSPMFLLLSGFVGAGLVFAGITNTCAMGILLAKLPYNQQSKQSQKQPMLWLIGHFFAICIGISLSLLDGGGSVLALPVLVYVIGVNPKPAIAMTPIIVGTVSLLGMVF